MKKKSIAVGLTIDQFNGIKPSTLLKVVKKLGLEFVELTSSAFDDLNSCKKIIGNMKAGLHLPNIHDKGYDFSCRDRKTEIDHLINLINDNHQELNITYCLTHPPECDSISEKEKSIPFLLDNLKKLKPPVIIENVQGWDEENFNNFYNQANSVLGEKLIGECFDAAHHILNGYNPVEFIENKYKNIRCVHLSDCKKGVDAHLPLGLGGYLPTDKILEKMKKVDYSEFINLELLPRNPQDIAHIIKSYLKVIKIFNKRKYYFTMIRLLLYKSELERELKNAF